MKSLLLISPLLAVFATGSDLACPKYAAEVTQIREEVQHTVFFCKYYLSSTRSRSPIPGIDAAKLVDTCVCVLREAHATIPSKHHGKPGAQPSLSAVACDPAAAKTIRAEYQDPTYFCKFDEAFPRNKSPIPMMTQDQISAGCQCILKPKSQPKPTSASSKHRSRASHHPSSISSMVPQTESTGQSTISQTDSVDATSSATTTTTTMTTTTSTTTSPTANPPMCTDGPAAVDYRGLNFDGHNYTVDYEVFNTTSSVYGAQVASAQSTTFPSMVASDAATTCASWVLQQQYVMDTWNMQIAYDEGNAWWDCAFWPDRYDDSHLADYSDNNITCAYTYHEASRNQV